VLRKQQEKYFIALEMFIAFFERKESDRKKRLRNRKFYLKTESIRNYLALALFNAVDFAG
jgi:hypothetical protein